MLRVVFDVVLLQERHELFLETPLAVMLGLRLDVRDRMRLLRNPDGECAVSFLPGEIARMLLVHPMRGCTFHELHGLGKGHGRGQRQQNMNVILRAARNKSLESVRAGDSAEEGPKISLNRRRNQVPAILRREHAMDETTNVGVRHGESVEQPADREEK